MNVTSLELTNFRNYSKCKFNKFDKINIIIGKNGIGKTSILEAIYAGSLVKTFKNNNDNVLIKTGSEFLKLKLTIEENSKKKKLEVIINSKGKKTKINSSLKKRLSDYISQYKVIVLSPDELKIIKDSPNIRRNYLNIEISQLNKSYIKKLNDYNTLIKNKNDYLKKVYLNKTLDIRYLDVLDEKIADIGIDIAYQRRKYVDDINKYIKKIFNKFIENETIFIKYESDFDNLDAENALKLLKKNRKKEIILGMTSTGIHRDDIDFLHNGRSAKEYSSQGIQKLIMLSIKLAELEIFIKQYRIYPILLLDDLLSELDSINQNKVLNNLIKKIQIFITTTDIDNIRSNILKKANIIELESEVKIYE